MKQTLNFSFYTEVDLSDIEKMRELFEYLTNSIVRPYSYDSIEKAKIEFFVEEFNSATQMYLDEGSLFIRGKEDGFTAHFTRTMKGFSLWGFYVDDTAMKKGQIDKWLVFFHGLTTIFPVLYGFGVHVDEYDAKHLSLKVLPGGGRVRLMLGISTADFFEHLPGIYWFTVFGDRLTDFFSDKFTLLDKDEVIITRLENGVTSLRLNSDPQASNMVKRLTKEREIAELLGEEYFFDRRKVNEVSFKQVPNLIKK